MNKIFLAATAASMALASTAALAKAPDGNFNFKDNRTYDQRCPVGALSAQITQNGQFVGSGNNNLGIDQTTDPGSRAEAIAALLLICRANGQNQGE